MYARGEGWSPALLERDTALARLRARMGTRAPSFAERPLAPRFERLALLGTGSAGQVWRAYDRDLRREVALKILVGHAGMAALRAEAQSLAQLNHPNVVSVYDLVETAEGHALVMEFARGPTLREWLDQTTGQQRSRREALSMLVGIARGMAGMHNAGIVHRDIKPENVVLGELPRIVDFGLATSQSQADRTSVGTPAYLAPECLRGAPADARADVFSFGVLACEVLGGSRPFAGRTVTELLLSIAQDPADLSNVPWRDRHWIDTCLAKDPAKRWANASAVVELLETRLRRPRQLAWGAVAVSMVAVAAPAAFGALSRAQCVQGLQVSALPLHAATSPALSLNHDQLRGYLAVYRGVLEQVCAAPKTFTAARSCLASAKAHVNVVMGALATQEESQPNNWFALVADAPDPRECLQVQRDVVTTWRPGERAQWLQTFARARLSLFEGHPNEAQTTLKNLAEQAERAHDNEQAARARIAMGQRLQQAGTFAQAEEVLLAAREAALQGERPDVAAEAELHLVAVVGHGPAGTAKARELAAAARARMQGRTSPAFEARLEQNLGNVAQTAGEGRVALAHHRASLAGFLKLYGNAHYQTGAALITVGAALSSVGNADEAETFVRRGVEVTAATLGTLSPAYEEGLAALSIVQYQQHNFS